MLYEDVDVRECKEHHLSTYLNPSFHFQNSTIGHFHSLYNLCILHLWEFGSGNEDEWLIMSISRTYYFGCDLRHGQTVLWACVGQEVGFLCSYRILSNCVVLVSYLLGAYWHDYCNYVGVCRKVSVVVCDLAYQYYYYCYYYKKKLQQHLRSSHYVVTHVRNKMVTFRVDHLMW